ncbi:hypothetical protein L209DRAFT_289974 [Thermothelomyces heterothallicus CBS 203.75]
MRAKAPTPLSRLLGHGQVTAFSHRGVPQLPLVWVWDRLPVIVRSCLPRPPAESWRGTRLRHHSPQAGRAEAIRGNVRRKQLRRKEREGRSPSTRTDGWGRRIASKRRDVAQTSRLVDGGVCWHRRAGPAPSSPSSPPLQHSMLPLTSSLWPGCTYGHPFPLKRVLSPQVHIGS